MSRRYSDGSGSMVYSPVLTSANSIWNESNTLDTFSLLRDSPWTKLRSRPYRIGLSHGKWGTSSPSLASPTSTNASFSTTPILLSRSPVSPAKGSCSSLPIRLRKPSIYWRKPLPQLPSLLTGSQQPIVIETDTSDYALTAILSIVTKDGELHPVAFHSWSFSPMELNYDVHDKELFAIYKAFRIWHHYLEGSVAPIDVITNHKNLKYFTTTKLLNCCQAWWLEYLSQFNLIIHFHSGKLGMKHDALTHWWDVYLKEGGGNYATVNPQNLKPIFSHEQL